MFNKILIANRGEIAVRVIRACQEMGIATVAVYSDADVSAPHVWLADEARYLGGAPASESYLAAEKLLNAAAISECDAVHPGYGFLSENADFAQAVDDAGMVFIGPRPQTIRTMGSKTAARALLQGAGVPVVAGYQDGGSDTELLEAAESLGYPLLVKAAAGGGGKGMRVVHKPVHLPAALQSARNEARNAFGDNQIFLERLVEEPRHIEFQIFGDTYGNIIHLFERECSIQRRHQKIVEESPAPRLKRDLRRQMGEAAIAAARAVNYINAGTVEFLVDKRDRFYFLEMNTRLQVEHPVTELVTGIDLVKLQVRVAAGEALPFAQPDLLQRGHAIECRIYAEDPAAGFSPSTGKIAFLREPSGPGVRVDSGVAQDNVIPIHYDPMLAKLIVLGESRSDAIGKMTLALREYVVLGDLVTNLPFLQDLISHPAFQQGETTTDFIVQHFAEWQPPGQGVAAETPPGELLIAAALADLTAASDEQPQSGESSDDRYTPWVQAAGFRIGK